MCASVIWPLSILLTVEKSQLKKLQVSYVPVNANIFALGLLSIKNFIAMEGKNVSFAFNEVSGTLTVENLIIPLSAPWNTPVY